MNHSIKSLSTLVIVYLVEVKWSCFDIKNIILSFDESTSANENNILAAKNKIFQDYWDFTELYLRGCK